MSVNWSLKKISDICEFQNNKRVPLKSLDREKRQGEYPYYGASGIVDYIDNYIFDGKFLLISEDGENLRTRNTPIAFQAQGRFWVNNGEFKHEVRQFQKPYDNQQAEQISLMV